MDFPFRRRCRCTLGNNAQSSANTCTDHKTAGGALNAELCCTQCGVRGMCRTDFKRFSPQTQVRRLDSAVALRSAQDTPVMRRETAQFHSEIS